MLFTCWMFKVGCFLFPIAFDIWLKLLSLVPKEDCRINEGDNWARRIYVGKESKSEKGTPCLNWKKVKEAKHLMGKEAVGNHNFCRNPSKAEKMRDYCYVTQNTTEFCRVRTCGKLYFHLQIFHISFKAMLRFMLRLLTQPSRKVKCIFLLSLLSMYKTVL